MEQAAWPAAKIRFCHHDGNEWKDAINLLQMTNKPCRIFSMINDDFKQLSHNRTL